MAQAQGSEGTLNISEELVFNTIPEIVVEDCETNWSESNPGAGATNALDAVDYKEGSNSIKITEDGASAAGDILATGVISTATLASYTHLVMWVKSSVTAAAGDIQVLLDETANCASPLETLDIPALVAGTWTQVKIVLANPSTDLLLISAGIKMVTDLTAFNFWIDNLRVIKQAHQVCFNSESLKRTAALNKSNAICGTRNPKAPTRGAGDVAGDITLEVNPFIGILFKHLFGGYSVSGADPYVHTFKIDSLPIGLNIEKGFTDIDQYFNEGGCKVNSFSSSMNPDGVVEGTFGIMGASQTVRTYTMDPDPITSGHIPFEGLEAEILEGVATLGTGTVVSVDMSNNCDGGVYVIGGGGDRHSIPAGMVSISGTLTILFENTTLYDKAVNFTESTLKLTWSRGDGLGSAGNEKLELYMNEVKYSEDTPAIEGPTGTLVNLPFEAYYDDDAQESAIYAKLYNSTASYTTY